MLGNLPPDGGWDAFDQHGNPDRTIALQQAGWRTALVGKYLNAYLATSGIPEGWDRWYALNREEKDWTTFSMNVNGVDRQFRDVYQQDLFHDQALSVIDETPAAQPLFLYFAPTVPHEPATPAPRYADALVGAKVERDAAFGEADLSDKPLYLRQQGGLDDAERAELDGLLRQRQRLPTGQHGWQGKEVPHDGSGRVPMLARGPRFALGATDNRLVANIDLAPTVADLAGINFGGDGIDGRSLLAPDRRDVILLEGFGTAVAKSQVNAISGVPPYRALRTTDLLYVEYRTGERELYDYRTDPLELDNELADWEGHEATADPALVADLSARLAALAGCRIETTCLTQRLATGPQGEAGGE